MALHPFDVIVARLGGSLLAALACFPLFVHSALERLFALPRLLQPRKDFLASAALGDCCRCFHLLSYLEFDGAKIQHFCEINAESLRFLYPSCLSMSKNSFRGLVSAVRFDARRLNLPKGMGSRRVDV